MQAAHTGLSLSLRGLSPLSQLPDLLLLVELDHPEPPQKIEAILLVNIRRWQYHVEFHQPLRRCKIEPREAQPFRGALTCLLTSL